MRQIQLVVMVGLMACGAVKAPSPDAALDLTVTISPVTPTTTDDLVATVSGGDASLLHFRWSANGTVRTDLTTAMVPNSETTKHDLWKVELVDGAGTVVGSADVTIANSAPSAPTLLLPYSAAANVPLTCAVKTESTDADADPITYTAAWTRNGVAVTTTTTTVFLHDTVAITAADIGRTFVCVVTASDGEMNATAQSVAVKTIAHEGFFINQAGTLRKIDLDSHAAVDIGAVGVTYAFGDLAWDRNAQILYMVDGRGAKSLYRVSTVNGAATLVGAHGITDMFALGFNPVDGKLYGVATGVLYTLNTATGAATMVGPLGMAGVSFDGLAFDTRRNVFLGSNANVGNVSFFTLDPATGTATNFASNAGGADDNGLTYDPAADRFWQLDFQGRLFAYDPSSATFPRTTPATGLGQNSGFAIALPN